MPQRVKKMGQSVIASINGMAMTLLAAAWVLLGLAGFVYSLVCAGKTPSMARAIMGIVIAVLFGPLYWVYWYADKQYCRGPVGTTV